MQSPYIRILVIAMHVVSGYSIAIAMVGADCAMLFICRTLYRILLTVQLTVHPPRRLLRALQHLLPLLPQQLHYDYQIRRFVPTTLKMTTRY